MAKGSFIPVEAKRVGRRTIIPVRPIPVFLAEIKGIWRFNDSLEDEVGSNDFSPSSGSASFTPFEKFELLENRVINRSGLLFAEDQIYSIPNSYSFAGDWTFSFWWYSPRLVGFTKHITTRNLESKVAPIIAMSDLDGDSTRITLVNSTFALTEIGYSKTKNAIRVYLTENGTDISHVYTSDAYDAPGLHHVLITYMRALGRFRIDIDGKAGISHSAPTTSLQQSGKIRLNQVVPGFHAHKTQQVGGYIFDLVFTSYGSTDNESLKAFRYGYEHISFDNLFDAKFAYFGVAYSQPTTISTTHIFVDGGNIFAARSNGKIVKGARPVWDKEFAYPDANSVVLLTTSGTDPEGESGDRFIVWTSDGLKIKGASIRI